MAVSTTEKLMNLLLRNGSLSRAGLSKLMQLSRPAVSALVDGLIRQGAIRETGCGASNGGKPPIMLEPVAEQFHAIGIDIGNETLLRGTICDATGKMLERLELPHDGTYESIAKQSIALVKSLKKLISVPVAGIGVAVAGQVDHAINEIAFCPNFPLRGQGLAKRLSQAVGLPVYLDNRARAAAQWEYFFGAARCTEDFIFISAERGIGTAIYLNGKLFRGRAGVAGEIRTLKLPTPAGNQMLPIEEAMNEKFLLKLAGEKFNTPELIQAWQHGDPNATRAIEYLADCTAYTTAVLTNLLDPALIVLGGRFRDLGTKFTQLLTARLEIDPPRHLEFRLSQSGRIGAALGATLGIILEKHKTI